MPKVLIIDVVERYQGCTSVQYVLIISANKTWVLINDAVEQHQGSAYY